MLGAGKCLTLALLGFALSSALTTFWSSAEVGQATPLSGQAPGTGAGGVRGASVAAPVTIDGKIDSHTGQLLIPVRLNNARFWCSLDSGWSALIGVDRTRAAQAGLIPARAIPRPDGAPPSTGEGRTPATLSIGSITVGEQSVILRDLPAEAPEMECIMGVGLLRRFVVELDYVTARVRLHDRGAYRPPAAAQQVPLIFRTNLNVPFVRIELTFADGTRQTAQVVPDTGSSYFAAVLVPAFVQSVKPRIPRTALLPQRLDSSWPALRLAAGRLAAISVGPFTQREPVVALIETGLDAGGIDDGTLGVGFFRRFTVAFDFEGRSMYLEPNEHMAERHWFDASGAAFRPNAGGFQVDVVLPDSVAARAGLREGDRLLEVDGRVSRNFTPIQLRDLLSRPGETRNLLLTRGDQTIRIALILEQRL
jgi:PDZ domain-containing protein